MTIPNHVRAEERPAWERSRARQPFVEALILSCYDAIDAALDLARNEGEDGPSLDLSPSLSIAETALAIAQQAKLTIALLDSELVDRERVSARAELSRLRHAERTGEQQ